MKKPEGTPPRITKDAHVRMCQPGDKQYKIPVREGLSLHVTPSGGRLWRVKFRRGGVEKSLSLGAYPEVSLAKALEGLADARKQLAQDADPAKVKQDRKQAIADSVRGEKERSANTFRAVAEEWFSHTKGDLAPTYGPKVWARLERYLLPSLGSLQINEITTPILLASLRQVEVTGRLDTAHRLLNYVEQIFRFCGQTGRQHLHPASDLRGALAPYKAKHMAAQVEPVEVGKILRALDGYQGSFPVQTAIRLAPLLFVRPGELRQMKWGDVDLQTAQWRFTASKTGTQMVVPLSTQAVTLLANLHPFTMDQEYVFPSIRGDGRPMSENTVLVALRALGISKEEMSGHGWRAVARTLLDEVLRFPVAWIEMQLGHTVKDVHGRAYNRTVFLDERTEMMQVWADYLDMLRNQSVS